jgi:peptidyl-tRNA hydrolase
MKKILIALSFLLFGTFANADCNIKSGSINILANDFPALRTLVETAREGTGKAVLNVTHSAELYYIADRALTANA